MKKARKVFSGIWGDQKGYSLIEFALVLALVAVMAGTVFAVYNYRVAPSTWSNSRFDLFNSVMASLNTCKSDRARLSCPGNGDCHYVSKRSGPVYRFCIYRRCLMDICVYSLAAHPH